MFLFIFVSPVIKYFILIAEWIIWKFVMVINFLEFNVFGFSFERYINKILATMEKLTIQALIF